MNCEETREHLEACDECRLHVAVEARLRTQPVLEPPKGLVARVMKALPRTVPVRREVLRLAAAAAFLMIGALAVFKFDLDRHQAVVSAKDRAVETFRSAAAALDPASWRSQP
jgi:hypothetical protein